MLDVSPALDVEGPLGDRLELLLDQLARGGLKISPRDRMLAAALVADLVARGKAATFPELRPSLAPLLARSPSDRERFFQVFELLAPIVDATISEPAPLVQPRPTGSRYLLAALGATAIFAVAALSWWFWPKAPDRPIAPSAPIERPSVAPPPIQTSAPAAASTFEILNRLADAAERFEGAPTIEELSRELAKTSTIGWRATSYAIRLNELSGLPKTWPLAMYGKDAKDGRIWAMLALALERIERPGREPTFAELLAAANEALAKQPTPRPVYDIANRLGGWLADPVESDKAKLIASIQDRHYAEISKREGKPTPGERVDDQSIQRALAITDDQRIRRVFADAPWVPPFPTSGAHWWAAWAAMLMPLALAVIWFTNSLTLRKAYLRRRPPELPPLHLDIVSEAASRVLFAANLFQRIAQKLRLRTPRSTDRLDLEASILATIAGGGEIPNPVYQTVRHSPEYLVLIERRAAGDQDAQRLRDLVRRLESLLPLNVFYYRTEPSRLEPEIAGRSVSIEQLQAQFPEHRLLILGSGADFLEPASLKPHPAAAKLTHWTQRALLTPLPLAEWGHEEFALANELQLPVGRATPEGLLWLADNLGLEGAETDNLLDTRGDGLARPLPELLRVRPQRFLYSAPPSGVPVGEIVRDLRNFLDGPGFEWLCALAVYPAVQWDLALYLGVSLPEQQAGDPARAPLYREDRIAALTQLPWLREGIMPNWLRTALIGELDQPRQSEIRAILKRLIDAAQLSGDVRRDDAIKLRIAQEATKERLPPAQLLQDEVLLDFLARGRIEDFALPNASWLERFLPRGWLDRIGIPELAAGVVALAYAVAAFWLTPKTADGALAPGAWLPLVALFAGAILAMMLADLTGTYRAVRTVFIRSAPLALAFTMIAGIIWLASALKPPLVVSSPVVLAIAFLLVSVAALWAAGVVAGWLGIPIYRLGEPPLQRWSLGLAKAVTLLVVAFAGLQVGEGLMPPSLTNGPSEAISGYAYLAVIPGAGLGAFVIGLIFSQLLPERLPPPKALPRGERASPLRGALRTAFSLLPILPAAWLSAYVASASIKLEPIPGGATAVAELPGGTLIALGGSDGLVRVYDTATNAARLLQTIATGSPVASLALRAERDGDAAAPTALAVSTANGRIQLFDARGGSQRPLSPGMADIRGEGSKVHIALAQGATPVAAIETATGEIRLVSSGGATHIADSGPVTALIPTGGELVAFATLDGRVRLSRVASGSAGVPRDSADPPRLPGRARTLRLVSGGSMLTALGDDGMVLQIPIREGRFDAAAAQTVVNERLRLGERIAWRQP